MSNTYSLEAYSLTFSIILKEYLIIKMRFSQSLCCNLLANKGKNNKESKSSDEDTSEEPKIEEQQHKPTQTKFSWKAMWNKDTFPRVVSAFGLVGKAFLLSK